MNRLSTIVWMAVIVVAAFMLYKVKYQVQALKTEIADTAHELEREKQAMHVVAAEWAYLNRPERLQRLAEKYLPSSALTVNQVTEIQAIPFPGQAMAMMDAPHRNAPITAPINDRGGAITPAAAHYRTQGGTVR